MLFITILAIIFLSLKLHYFIFYISGERSDFRRNVWELYKRNQSSWLSLTIFLEYKVPQKKKKNYIILLFIYQVKGLILDATFENYIKEISPADFR